MFNASVAQTQTTTQAAQKDTVKVGTVIGLLRDSVHNYVLQSTTLAIYKVQGNELVSYQLTNNFGRYQFKEIPVGMPLYIVATHVGYQSTKREFSISPKTKTIDLKTINMQRLDVSLKEVTISAVQAPMQMRGDTLEFNASAFKLDSNAVVGDLLRKLPGVTVWADGVITVNGKKINQLLVNGKDFFGGDNRIALDNLPKNSVQKVQVYQDKNDKDPVNPKTDMNIVLKKDKQDGMFGKFGGGYGSRDHYAGDGMLTYFSPKTQVSLVGAYNNVNKTAYDVGTLMRFNSFKGEGINNDYHSDFRRAGVNVFRGGGVTFSQDFSKDSDPRQPYFKTNLLKGEVFSNDLDNKTIRQSETIISLGDNGHLNQTSDDTRHSNDFSLRSNASYQKRTEHSSINASYNINNSQSTAQATQNNRSVNDQTQNQSRSFEQQNTTRNSTNASGSVALNTNRYYDFGKQKNKSFNTELKYTFDLNHSNEDSKNITDFTATDATQNKYFNRQYLKDIDGGTHTFVTNLKDVTQLFQRRGNRFVQIDLNNTVKLHHENENDNVGDLASGASAFTPNKDLTNISHYKTIDEKPSVVVSKDFWKSLDNRFYKSWHVFVNAQAQIFDQKNDALQTFQNIDRSYRYFIPATDFTYYNNQYGEYSKNYSFGYYTSVIYPTVSQLAPLVDNADVYSITVGNMSLKPAYRHDVYANYAYYDQKKKNPINYRIELSANLIRNNIAESTRYDELGRSVHQFINLAESKSANYNGWVNKAFNFKDHQFQLSGNSDYRYSEYTTNVNGRDYLTRANSFSASASLVYTFKSIWRADVGEGFEGSKTNQIGLSRYTNYNWATNLGLSFAFPKSLFFDTRANINNNKTSASDHNIYYTIWNADVGYRFLKGSNGEIKFSVLDILHQNKSLENYIGANTLTTTTANVLQQYFMLTLAYYPRHFGLHKKK
ncbi:outer membrane beta-barrel protein [Mucilaginibacter panaciglaebae]|uniref:Carboxypeptidase-like regulatory domain-containing protein n=1 Tax=Mucilaginibacter panaciglaebae TaxID=502331 RepID=A0ABP7WXL1_9SPHI